MVAIWFVCFILLAHSGFLMAFVPLNLAWMPNLAEQGTAVLLWLLAN